MRQLSPYEHTQLSRYGTKSGVTITETIPIEYVTGKAEFCGLTYAVSPAVLIPRVETEQLVELALQEAVPVLSTNSSIPVHIVEVGTGSGAVSIALAKHLAAYKERVRITAGEYSPTALEVARQNQAQLLTHQECSLTLVHSNLLENIPLKTPPSLIVANLPYIPTNRLSELDKSVIEHEPREALDGGGDGFALIRQLLHQALTSTNSQTRFVLEVDDTHTEVFWQQQTDLTCHYTAQCIPDFQGKQRFILAQRTHF